MKKLILGSAIAILTILFVSLIVCICVICRQSKKIKDLEAKEPEIKYVEVEVEVELKKIYYGDNEGNVYELIGKAYNKNGAATIFVQNIVTKGVWFEVERTFLENHHILEDYEP